MADPLDSANRATGAPARPLDARLARALVRPLDGTAARPNHLTTLRLAIGIASTICLTHENLAIANVGAFLFALSNFVDHADGELARLSGAFSRLGHAYDLACDAIIHTLLFAAVGWSLMNTGLGVAAPIMGLIAGGSVAFIFWLHMVMETELGKAGAKLPSAGLFEIEDVLYLFPLVTLCNVREPFLIISFIGAPAFALWLTWYFRQLRAARASVR
ncbi:CDP-alcohol phosphatidyltransferase family protein [Salinisphaera sp. Q1T1-3]|uniref:CDP-alcohol phosphatidyltransferase family protein n=1 Tax=Salinisphaera sp. Q1T1-3 TaxID=2321229 RepID=UPI000E7505F0|nr:CDP-alcohol phosphatidyltransferase family protein [Salinisphaera sp. Q1T1-3]RJS93967.1 CDP-alcohol phosphatidyltransferase family protein [Salinisphaera sp. Q1T1-3]